MKRGEKNIGKEKKQTNKKTPRRNDERKETRRDRKVKDGEGSEEISQRGRRDTTQRERITETGGEMRIYKLYIFQHNTMTIHYNNII